MRPLFFYRFAASLWEMPARKLAWHPESLVYASNKAVLR
jgi:hypothetical protein